LATIGRPAETIVEIAAVLLPGFQPRRALAVSVAVPIMDITASASHRRAQAGAL
jgi:hypothetical protein